MEGEGNPSLRVSINTNGGGMDSPAQSGAGHPFHYGYQVASPQRLPPMPGVIATPAGSPSHKRPSQGTSKQQQQQFPNPLATSAPRSPIHIAKQNYSYYAAEQSQPNVRESKSVEGSDGSPARLMLGSSMSHVRNAEDDSGQEEFQPLHVRLLKERIELEVAMRREGTRCFVFALFSICLCVALSIASHTQERNATRWLITQGLGLDDIEDVRMPGDVYNYMTSLSSNARQFFPLSSAYVDDPLAAVIIGARQVFSSGPLQVAGDAQPSLRVEWSMTTWLSYETPVQPRPHKRLIIRKYLPNDDSGLSCWAWYTKGPERYIFEYGRHNMDEGYVELELDFSVFNQSVPTSGEMRLAGIVVNATHLRALQQVEGQQVSVVTPLMNGFPTDCAGSNMEVGDDDLSLADLTFHPRQLTDEQFVEIVEGGQTLYNIASGTAPNPAVDLDDGTASEQSVLTQEMVSEASAQQISLTRVLGNLVEAGISLLSDGRTVVDDVLPSSSPTSSAANDGTNATRDGNYTVVVERWEVIGGSGAAVNPLDLSPAFEALRQRQAGPGSFTLSWWAKVTRPPSGLTELLFNSPAGMPRLQVKFSENGAYESVDAWEFSFYNSPHCWEADDITELSDDTISLCQTAPAWWCQAPMTENYAGTYDGIWRHFALRFQYAEQSRPGSALPRSALELYLDGQLLCGTNFLASIDFVPQGSLASPSTAKFGVIDAESDGDSDISFILKDVRLYDRAISSSDLKELGLDSAVRECTNLEITRDNPDFSTEFGLACSDLSLLAEANESEDSPLAPSACLSSPDILLACPISCVQEGNPVCWDRMPPSFGGQYPEPVSPVTAEYTYPRRFLAELFPAPTAEAQAQLLNAQTWSDNSNGTWQTVMDSIELSEYNEIMVAESEAQLQAGVGYYLSRDGAENSGDDSWWRTGGCPGAASQASQDSTLFRLHSRMCDAERSYRDRLSEMFEQEVSMEATQGSFPDGLLASDSFSLWFWAKANDVEDGATPAVAGTDSNNTICFFIEGDRLFIPAAEGFAAEPLQLIIPGDHGAIKDDTWIFYAIVVNSQRGVASFGVNEHLQEVTLEVLAPVTKGISQLGGAEAWGCSSLTDVVNVGTSLHLSPVRVSKTPMLPGTLQKVYLDRLPEYRNILIGPQTSRSDLLSRQDRPRANYKMRVLALSPPIALQQRANSSDADSACKGVTIEAFNAAVNNARQLQCQAPYKCDSYETSGNVAMKCVSDSGNLATSFMGRPPLNTETGPYFPEFMWVLENSLLVRNSEDLSPQDSYIDLDTLETVFYFVFFSPDNEIATVLTVTFDFRSARVAGDYDFTQIKFLTQEQLREWLGWMIAACLLIAIHVLLAVPAGVQEGKDLVSWIRQKLRSVTSHDNVMLMSPKQKRPPERYTQDTSQPDLLDIIFSTGVLVYCLYLLVFTATRIYDEGPQLFADIAIIDWASSDTFAAKTSRYLDALSNAVELVEVADQLREAAFWVLICCCVRVILYLKVHPRIAAVTRTFEVCFWELLNFFFSFGVIYVFLAFIAHIKFGFLYDEFATLSQSMVTQFAILIGDNAPDYADDGTLFVYVVIYVFVCTLALLNFLLAIVVAGYDSVREKALENQVATSFAADAWGVPVDGGRWLRHGRWPSKVRILNTLFRLYPVEFSDPESQVFMGESEFVSMVQEASRGKASPRDALLLFAHYQRYPFLLAKSH